MFGLAKASPGTRSPVANRSLSTITRPGSTHSARRGLFERAGALIAEITRQYYADGDESVLPRAIANRDAHVAATEAFGLPLPTQRVGERGRVDEEPITVGDGGHGADLVGYDRRLHHAAPRVT